jgi:hypothetical protein
MDNKSAERTQILSIKTAAFISLHRMQERQFGTRSRSRSHRALTEISSIERLIVSAQRRLNDFLEQLTERRDKRVATMRDTANLAIGKA